MASRGKYARSKGQAYQREVCQIVAERFNIPQSDISSTPNGAPGKDILLSSAARRKFPISVEAKNTETLSIWKAIEQSESHIVGPDKDLIPVVVFTRKEQDNYACLKFDDLLDLIDLAYNQGAEIKYDY